MSNNSQSRKEKLCKVAIRKMMLEAKKEASAEFKSFPDKVSKDLKYSNDDKEVILSRLLYDEYNKYDKIFDVNETAKLKTKLLKRFIKTKEIYDEDMNFNNFDYEGQKRKITEELVIARKMEYLEGLKSEIQESKTQPVIEKIKWSRGVSEFGYMMLLLVDKNYIELPTGQTLDGSYERFARMLFQTFEVTDSWPSFKDALNTERNRLSEIKRLKLDDFPEDFPESRDLGPLKKK
jgi:hypothetical protein